jgi:hypothetical protein
MSYRKGQRVLLNINYSEEWTTGMKKLAQYYESVAKEKGYLTIDSHEANGFYYLEELGEWIPEDVLSPFEEEFPGAPTMSEIFTW